MYWQCIPQWEKKAVGHSSITWVYKAVLGGFIVLLTITVFLCVLFWMQILPIFLVSGSSHISLQRNTLELYREQLSPFLHFFPKFILRSVIQRAFSWAQCWSTGVTGTAFSHGQYRELPKWKAGDQPLHKYPPLLDPEYTNSYYFVLKQTNKTSWIRSHYWHFHL